MSLTSVRRRNLFDTIGYRLKSSQSERPTQNSRNTAIFLTLRDTDRDLDGSFRNSHAKMSRIVICGTSFAIMIDVNQPITGLLRE